MIDDISLKKFKQFKTSSVKTKQKKKSSSSR